MSRTTHTSHTRSLASRRRSLVSATAVALLAGAATFGIAAPALAHDELLSTDLVLNDAGTELESFQLTFSNSIIEVGTEIVVTSVDGADISDGAPQIAGPVVTQPLTADLAPGSYTAAWRVVSSDGHPIDGAFGIEIPANGVADAAITEPDPQSTQDEADHEHAEGDHDHAAGTEHDDHGSAADADAAANEGAGLPVGGIIAASIGGLIVVAGGVGAAIFANRRRAQGMAADAARAAESSAPEHVDGNTSAEGDTK